MIPEQPDIFQEDHSFKAHSDAEKEPVLLSGRKLYLAGRGISGLKQDLQGGCPVFFWPMSEQHGKDIAQAAQYVCARVNELTMDTDLYLLAAFTVDDWNLELSPWNAEIPEIGQSFGGGAGLTLQWILEDAFSYIRSRSLAAHDPEDPGPAAFPAYAVGYSLAGLFSLWAELETREKKIFAGAAGCSATMWFPGWLEHARKKTEKEADAVEAEVNQMLLLEYIDTHIDELNSEPLVGRISDIGASVRVLLDNGIKGKVEVPINIVTISGNDLFVGDRLVCSVGDLVSVKLDGVRFKTGEVVFLLERNLDKEFNFNGKEKSEKKIKIRKYIPNN